MWELEASLDAKRAVCDRLERQLQLSANQMQRQHDVEERCSEAQRRLRLAETTVQQLQADLQVSLSTLLSFCCYVEFACDFSVNTLSLLAVTTAVVACWHSVLDVTAVIICCYVVFARRYCCHCRLSCGICLSLLLPVLAVSDF